jgi:hypothetical protein
VTGHLTPELIFGHEHGLLSPGEVRSVYRHIEECEECRSRVAKSIDISGLLATVPAPRRRTYARYVAAAAVVLAACLGWWFWLHLRSQPLETASVELPAFLQELNPPPQTLMGAPAAGGSLRMSPQGTAVLAARPTFSWPEQSGEGWTYRVQVFDLRSNPVLESGDLAVTQWTASKELAPGVSYEWQVSASRSNQRLTLPGLAGPPPRFRVIDPDTVRSLSELVARGASHAQLASAYARAGAVDQARRELDVAIREQPNNPGLRRLRGALRFY